MSDVPLLSIDDVVVRFPARYTVVDRLLGRPRRAVHALNAVRLAVRRGETLGIVGESGCGKSTLARTIVRLIEPDDGRVRFAGEDIGALTGAERRGYNRRVQMVFQDPYGSLNPRMTVRQVLAEALSVHRMRPKAGIPARIAELLDLVRLSPDAADRLPHQFSGGQRQRIGIARALAVEPEVLVADELVSALDVSVQAQVVNLLLELQERLHLTVLFVAHDLRLVRHISHRVAVMYLGSVMEVGETETLFASPPPSLHAHPPRRRARPRSRASPLGTRRARRIAEPAETALRLPVPHALPARLRSLPGREAGARPPRTRRPSGLPPSSTSVRRPIHRSFAMDRLPELRTGRPGGRQGHLAPIEGLEIPFGIVEGAAPGPCLLVTAGVHASEYCSIEAAVRLMKTDPAILKGTLVILPILNISGFKARSIYVMPEDGKNLNRMFPGSPDGSAGERLAHWLVTECFPKADAYLDLHGGDMSEALAPFTIYPAAHAPSKALAAAFGLPVAVASSSSGNTVSAAGALGIPSVLTEIGGNGLWDEAGVTGQTDGIVRVMRHLGMVEGASASIVPTFMTMSVPLAPASGLWYPAKGLSDPVAVGDRLGEIRDVFGAVLATIAAEKAGTVLYRLTTLAVNAGEALIGIGTRIEAAS